MISPRQNPDLNSVGWISLLQEVNSISDTMKNRTVERILCGFSLCMVFANTGVKSEISLKGYIYLAKFVNR
ncbi:hypothetical protein KH5_03490 [Urechidicola sp. KH5]